MRGGGATWERHDVGNLPEPPSRPGPGMGLEPARISTIIPSEAIHRTARKESGRATLRLSVALRTYPATNESGWRQSHDEALPSANSLDRRDPGGSRRGTTCNDAVRHIPWSVWGSNPRPPPCKGGALPAELTPLHVAWQARGREDTCQGVPESNGPTSLPHAVVNYKTTVVRTGGVARTGLIAHAWSAGARATSRALSDAPGSEEARNRGLHDSGPLIHRVWRRQRGRRDHPIAPYSCAGSGSIVRGSTGTCTSSRCGEVMSTTRMRGKASMNEV